MDEEIKKQRIFELRQQMGEINERIQMSNIALRSCKHDLALLLSVFQPGDLIESKPDPRTKKVDRFVVDDVMLTVSNPTLLATLIKKDGTRSAITRELWSPNNYHKIGTMELPKKETPDEASHHP